jgi:hypothetical protein
MLIFFGFYWITAEQSRPKAKIKVAARSTGAKALVIANWSSPFDVLYLVGRYNVDKFLLPVVENKAADPSPKQGMKVARVQVIGVRSVGFFRAMMATGYPPAVAQPGRKYLSLEQGFDTARTAAAVFPEARLMHMALLPALTRRRARHRTIAASCALRTSRSARAHVRACGSSASGTHGRCTCTTRVPIQCTDMTRLPH